MRFPCQGGDAAPYRAAELGFQDFPCSNRPVDLPELLESAIKTIRTYVSMPETTGLVVALWALHTHALPAFEATPRLLIRSDRPASGKSTLLGLLSCLVSRPLDICGGTPRAIFRSLGYMPTFLIDDAPALINGSKDMGALLRNGSRRLGARLLRTDDGYTQDIDLFAAAAIVVNGPPPALLDGRCIEIWMERATPDEIAPDPGLDIPLHVLSVQRKMGRWAKDNAKSLRACKTSARPGEDENWRPLLAIAASAGEEWEQRTRAVVESMRSRPSLLEQVLADIQSIFATRTRPPLIARNGKCITDLDRMRSADLARLLGELDERPWRAWGQSAQPITAHALAKLLAPAGIHPTTLNFHTADQSGPGPLSHDKGYVAGQFTNSLTLRLPRPENRETNSDKVIIQDFPGFFADSNRDGITDGNGDAAELDDVRNNAQQI